MTYHSGSRVVLRKQLETGVPKHKQDKPIEEAFIDIEALEGYCYKYGVNPSDAIARFLSIDPDKFDKDKAVVLMREQARVGLECVKIFKPADLRGLPSKIEVSWGTSEDTDPI